MTTISGYARRDASTGQLILEDACGPFLAATVTGIDLMSTGQTTIWTVPSIGGGSVFIPTSLILMNTATTAITVPPIITAGVSTALTSLLASVTLTGLTTVGKFADLMTSTALQLKTAVAQGQIIQIDVTTGSTASTHTATAALFGYFIG